MRSMRIPSPAMVVALVALFVALSGTAVAAGVVPLAKRALSADKAKVATLADNAKKLGGKTPAQLAAQAAALPGPASSAAGLVTMRTAPFTVNAADGQAFTAPCAAGEKAISGGYTYDAAALVMSLDSVPTANLAGWQVYLFNFSEDSAVSGTVHAVCIK